MGDRQFRSGRDVSLHFADRNPRNERACNGNMIPGVYPSGGGWLGCRPGRCHLHENKAVGGGYSILIIFMLTRYRQASTAF